MKFDKEATEGALLGVLYANNPGDMLLSQLYNRMRVDDRIDINMPRLLKAIAAAINKGYVEWGFNVYSSDTSLDLVAVFRLTDKGIMKAQELAEEGQPHLSKKTQEKAEEPEHAWGDEFSEYDDEADDEDEFAEYDDEDEFAKEDYEDDAPEDSAPEDSKDSKDSEESKDSGDEAKGKSTTKGINSDESTDALGSITPRTVAINKDEAYWVDTHDELTPEEYEDILGVSREEFKDDINEAIDDAIEYHENGGIEDEEEYKEDEDDYIEDEDEDESTDDDDDNCAQFCHICGTIADLQDNFCCVCGHRLFPGLQDPIIVKVIPTRKPSEGKTDARHAADEVARQRQRQRQQDKLDNIDILYNMFEKLGVL